MTAIDKAKEALLISRRIICNECSLKDGVSCKHDGAICHDIKKILEALAALESEKPSNDAQSVLEIVRNFQDGCDLEGVGFMVDDDDAVKRIHQFAVDYHKQKCTECKKQPAKCALCGDPISIGVCENCVPEKFDAPRFESRSGITTDKDR